MKIKCNRAALYEAAQLASSIIPLRTPKEILRCAKLVADKDAQTLHIIATDNEVTINYQVSQVQVETGGSLVLPADRIAAILHESIDDTISLELTGSTCLVTSKDSRFNIYGFDSEDFPVIEVPTPQEAIGIQAKVLHRMIHMTSFAAAKENTRYAINGVLWEQNGKKLRMVATDGRRLARIDGRLATVGEQSEQIAIVPVKAMGLIERILYDPDENISVSFLENKVVVTTANVKIMANLVQGRFPKYSDVVPSGCDKTAKMDTEPLHSCIRRAALLTNESSKGIKMEFTKDLLDVSSSTPETGDAEAKMTIKYDGEDFTIGFNPQYVLDLLRIVEAPEVVGEFIANDKPGMFKVNKDFLYVIMPVEV